MAIQNRRGEYADFDESKMVAGEFAVVQSDDPNTTDGKALYIAFGAGDAKRIATYDEVENVAEDTVDEKVGNLNSLTTTDKSDSVSAINEVNGKANTNAGAIGNLQNLDTTDKSNLVAAINEAAQSGGGGGTSDYTDLDNKPQINGVTLNGNKTAADLGITVPQAATATPEELGTAAIGSSSKYAKEDHVHPMPSASDVGAASEDELIDLYPTATASGAIASFSDGADGLPVKSLTVDIEPIQSGSGDPSPDNIRPITGHTSVGVWREATYDTTAQPQITIPLGQTVYGGTLDVTNGVLTVTHGYFTDDGSASWTRNSNGSFYVYTGNKNVATTSDGYCNISPYVYSVNAANSIWARPNGTVQINEGYSSTWTSVDELKAYLAETPLQLVYPLATPQTIQLTPQELTTLLGTNNIWSDVGDVEVEYRADIGRYIQKLINNA